MQSLVRYDVFRVQIGKGLADFVGVIQAASYAAAEEIGKETLSYDPRLEYLDFQVQTGTDLPLACLVCGKPAATAYLDRLEFPSCGAGRCEMKMQGGIDAHENGTNR